MQKKLLTTILILSMLFLCMPTSIYATESFNEESDVMQDEQVLSESEEAEKITQQINDLSEKNIDFSSKRLIVKNIKKELNDEPVISDLAGVKLLQYDDYTDAIDAYYRLSEISDTVEFDSPMMIASVGVAGVNGEDVPPMTEEENPFKEAEEVKTDKIKYDVAVIDTGANDADKIVSVLGDDGKDGNGHGQKMVDTIRTYAPDATILSIKAIDDNGIGNVSAVYAAIKLAIDEKVDYINLSISALASEDNFIIEEVIKEAQNKGIKVVGAAGNNGIDAGLTIPGRIKDIIVVGAVNQESNTGDSVDYYVPVASTSVATAIVTGLLMSNTLDAYEIEDKIIKIETDNDDDSSSVEPTEEFQPQDGSGSSGDNGDPGSGGNPVYTKSRSGKAFVWYDRGGWIEETQAGAGRIPAQGYFDASKGNDGEGRWYDNNGANPKKTQAAFYTCDFFIDLIGSKSTFDGYKYKWGNNYAAGDRHKELRAAMEKACRNAIADNKTVNTKARVIGVALTYIKWDNLKWSNTNVWGDCWYIGSYEGSKKFTDMFDAPTNSTGTKGLSEKYGWSEKADPNTANSVQEGETWRSYIWRKSKNENQGKEKVGYGYQMWVVAVSDDWPDKTTPINIQLVKSFGTKGSNTTTINRIIASNSLYSVTNLKFKLYQSKSDAKNDRNAVTNFTIGSNGKSEVREVEKNTTYYLVEISPARTGAVIPDVLRAENGGKAISTGETSSTISIGDSGNIGGPFTVTYKYKYASDLPAAVIATLPASRTVSAGTTVTPASPSSTSVVVGSDTYIFSGWDMSSQYADDDMVFTGSWDIADPPEEPEEEWTLRTFSYDFISNDGNALPDEIFDLLPTDNRDSEGREYTFNSGDTITPATLSETQITVDGTTYVFVGWDKLSYTFTNTYENVIFTGTWRKE